ncbi:MAG: hypothetical protein BWZ04_03067 [Firmicutes bacterium ADurb.BinA205]|nr:MAG: hypothetical protein BWZ04_03067 [Firmicutes bacterium ADurb.BinA205]
MSYGGAIYVAATGTLNITATFSGNTAAKDGGAIAIANGTVNVSGSSFTSNTATLDGGAIAMILTNQNASLTLSGTNTFSGNTAANGNDISLENTAADKTGTLTLNGTTGTLDVYGDSERVSIVDNTSSRVYLKGTVGSLTLNNANADVTLSGALTIANSLTLTQGYLWLGSYNVSFNDYATCSGGSLNSMILINGTGDVIKYFEDAGSFNFQIGTVSGSTKTYTPISITFTSGYFAPGAYLDVRVDAAKNANIPGNTYYLNRYWTVTPSGISSYGANVSATYVATDVSGTESIIKPQRYSGIWNQFGSILNHVITGAVTGFGQFTAFGTIPSPTPTPVPPPPQPTPPPAPIPAPNPINNSYYQSISDIGGSGDFGSDSGSFITSALSMESSVPSNALNSIGDGENGTSVTGGGDGGHEIGAGRGYGMGTRLGGIANGEHGASSSRPSNYLGGIVDGEHAASLREERIFSMNDTALDFSGMSVYDKFEKHIAFKSDTDILLDAFIAV